MYNDNTALLYDYNSDSNLISSYLGQIHDINRLCLTDKYPHIGKIIKTSTTISISYFDLISNPLGRKIVISALKHIKVVYKKNNSYNEIYSAKFTVPFCMFIPIDENVKEIHGIGISTEDIYIDQVDKTSMNISMTILAWPILNNKNSNDCFNHEKGNSDSHIHSSFTHKDDENPHYCYNESKSCDDNDNFLKRNLELLKKIIAITALVFIIKFILQRKIIELNSFKELGKEHHHRHHHHHH